LLSSLKALLKTALPLSSWVVLQSQGQSVIALYAYSTTVLTCSDESSEALQCVPCRSKWRCGCNRICCLQSSVRDGSIEVRLERVLGVPTEAAGAFNCVVAASNKWSTFNCVDDLPTKSQASILAHLNMRYTKRESSTWSRKPDSGASP
jgi:hypothetical protein